MPPSIGWLVVCVTYLAFQVCTSFAFMKGLPNAMTDEDPGKYPSIEDDVLRRFRIRDLKSLRGIQAGQPHHDLSNHYFSMMC